MTKTNKPDYELARDELEALIQSLGLKIEISSATGGVDTERGGNWVHLAYTVTVNGQAFPYRMGEAYAKVESVKIMPGTGFLRVPHPVKGQRAVITDRDACTMMETRKNRPGCTFRDSAKWAGVVAMIANASGVAPSAAEVLGCVARDAEAQSMTFDEWAGEYGYDTDSRKAEDTYRGVHPHGADAPAHHVSGNHPQGFRTGQPSVRVAPVAPTGNRGRIRRHPSTHPGARGFPMNKSPRTIEDLQAILTAAQNALEVAEQARDAWEPDSDNTDHTAAYDSGLDELYRLPGGLSNLSYSTLAREHDEVGYRCGFNDWEDGIRGERARRQTWSDFDELCEAVEEAEAARDEAQEALDEAAGE
jgi:hypothetical protein